MDEQQLLKLKKDIEEAKTEVSELKGSRKHLMQQLKEQWGCASIDQAAKKLEKLKEEEQILEKKIAEGIKQLEKIYDYE